MRDKIIKKINKAKPEFHYVDQFLENEEITRVCSFCGKAYKDKKITINGVPCYKYAICGDCKKQKFETDF